MPTSEPPGGPSLGVLGPRLDTVVDERRASRRSGRRINVTLAGLGAGDGLRCVSEDICAGGLYVHVPAGSGLSVGNRVEVTFGDEVESSVPSPFRGESCFATVVRTKSHSQESPATLGAGLRFDQPLYL
jgi:hypothetical protein